MFHVDRMFQSNTVHCLQARLLVGHTSEAKLVHSGSTTSAVVWAPFADAPGTVGADDTIARLSARKMLERMALNLLYSLCWSSSCCHCQPWLLHTTQALNHSTQALNHSTQEIMATLALTCIGVGTIQLVAVQQCHIQEVEENLLPVPPGRPLRRYMVYLTITEINSAHVLVVVDDAVWLAFHKPRCSTDVGYNSRCIRAQHQDRFPLRLLLTECHEQHTCIIGGSQCTLQQLGLVSQGCLSSCHGRCLSGGFRRYTRLEPILALCKNCQ